MINVVVVSHGDLASALLRAAEMIAGPQEHVVAVEIQAEESLESLSALFADVLRRTEPEPVLVLVDLLGGTPYNVGARYVLRDMHYPAREVECVTGVNLPMLLESLVSRDGLTLSELAALVARVGQESVRNLGPSLRENEPPGPLGREGEERGPKA